MIEEAAPAGVVDKVGDAEHGEELFRRALQRRARDEQVAKPHERRGPWAWASARLVVRIVPRSPDPVLFPVRLGGRRRRRYKPRTLEDFQALRKRGLSETMTERTLSIIKPDATRRNLTGKINAVIEDAGLRIVAQRRIRMTPDAGARLLRRAQGKAVLQRPGRAS